VHQHQAWTSAATKPRCRDHVNHRRLPVARRGGQDLGASAFEELLGDVSSQLFGVYGDDTVVYPGHGDDTTLGAERPHLEEWRERGW